jgi:hypothetical protein
MIGPRKRNSLPFQCMIGAAYRSTGSCRIPSPLRWQNSQDCRSKAAARAAHGAISAARQIRIVDDVLDEVQRSAIDEGM